MKNTLVIILFLFSSNLIKAQDVIPFSFHAGIDVALDQVRSLKLGDNQTYFNYGLVAEVHLHQRWLIHANLSHSIRNYEVIGEGLLFGTDFQNGTTSYYSSVVEEKLIEFENLVKYQFLQKQFSPIIGAGYSIQVPYAKSGERMVVHSDGFVESLRDPEDLDFSLHYSFYAIAGFKYEFADKITLLFDLGHKWNFNTDLVDYGFPTIDEARNWHRSLLLNVGLIYRLR